ncbi:nucleoside triphosphate pyrophosphohydrolase [Pararhizobium haloflavum]|uniref:nucleoside triphosphate pyrophosphohydrolase n=1 Tax=Pararhizobium haloflavum TaxID=2037914 RepID=UPI000C187251|nr:nucleoside triphosphate pyrophosphohydrolase [Pararhizobium haloflavum]
MQPSRDIAVLIDIMAALRTPGTGCPWDLQQDFQSIKPYTIEEAYEVADAIERSDMDDLCDELGDLLLQVVFHARMAEEDAAFDFGEVVRAITAKLIRRHPHVFGGQDTDDPALVKINWESIKAEEKTERAERRRARGQPIDEADGLLDGVPRALPALTEALKIQQKAARVGFDWKEAGPIIDKIEEEIGELRAAMTAGRHAAVSDELGDVIFAVANLGRHLDVDPEIALRDTNAKFRRRFAHIEASLAAEDIAIADAGLERMEALWQAAKDIERAIDAPAADRSRSA